MKPQDKLIWWLNDWKLFTLWIKRTGETYREKLNILELPEHDKKKKQAFNIMLQY